MKMRKFEGCDSGYRGAVGFIQSHLVEQLLNFRYQVVGMGNFANFGTFLNRLFLFSITGCLSWSNWLVWECECWICNVI